MASVGALARVALTVERAAARTAAPSARRMSGEAKPPPKPAPVAPKPALAAPKPAARGSSFFERLSAFLVGAGVGAGVGYYHLAKEIDGSTAALQAALETSHKDLSDRLAKLEAKS